MIFTEKEKERDDLWPNTQFLPRKNRTWSRAQNWVMKWRFKWISHLQNLSINSQFWMVLPWERVKMDTFFWPEQSSQVEWQIPQLPIFFSRLYTVIGLDSSTIMMRRFIKSLVSGRKLGSGKTTTETEARVTQTNDPLSNFEVLFFPRSIECRGNPRNGTHQ